MRKLMIIMLVLVLSIGGTVEAASYPEWREDAPQPERPHLTKSGGVFDGPSGKETYYNLPMGQIITTMRNMGSHRAELQHKSIWRWTGDANDCLDSYRIDCGRYDQRSKVKRKL